VLCNTPGGYVLTNATTFPVAAIGLCESAAARGAGEACHQSIGDRLGRETRLFEATGMGACVVTENSDDIEAFFSPNREIVTYSDLEECVTVVKELLEHPKKARDIGKKGQERTLRDHTYDRRIGTLLGHLRNVQLM